ncbi:MAG: ABC transporter ATP-binding protein [Phaeospirillum sp.]|nr:ABC transporter ATP-binding protein [Phaeospirillum sp.]
MMIRIHAQNLTVEYPVYDVQARSLRHLLMLNPIANRLAGSRGGTVGGVIGQGYRGTMLVSALKGLNFEINKGDRVGLIGHNGAGKTTLLRTLAGIYEPVAGDLSVWGRVMPLFNVTDGIDVDSTGYEAIHTRGLTLGFSRELMDKADEIAEFTGLGEYLYMPIRTYSSGMLVRLAFAIATAITPDILLMDEIIGAGDSAFVDRAEARLKTFVRDAGIMVVASHSEAILRQWCNKAMLLHKGEMVEFGDVDLVIKAYHTINNQ